MQFNWLVSIWWGTLVVKGLKYEPIHSISPKNIRKPLVFFRVYKMETLARNVLKTFLLPQWCHWSILQFLQLPEVAHNPFHATDLFLYILKISENQRFSNVPGVEKKIVAWNGLSTMRNIKNIKKQRYSERTEMEHWFKMG